MRTILKLLGLGAALALLVAGAAGDDGRAGLAQGVLTVCPEGCDFTSIQAAIAAAPEGGTVQVKAGTYQESLTITKPLSLVGEGAHQTVIEGGVAVLATKVVSLSGFTVRGQGVQVQDSQTVALTDVAIVEGRGDGLAVVNSGTVTVRASTIRANHGAGVLISLGSRAIVSANEIVGNGGDGISIAGSQADVRDNLIAGNGGCGIRADEASQVTGGGNHEGEGVTFSTIQAAIDAGPVAVPPEKRPNGEGAACGSVPPGLIVALELAQGSIVSTGETILIGPGTYQENLTITKSVVLRGAGPDKTVIRSAQESTPVVHIEGSAQVTLEGLTLTGASGVCIDYPESCPHGLMVRGQARVTLQNSQVSSNRYKGLFVRDSAQVTVKDSTVSGNGDDGLFVRDSAQVTVQNSQVSGNRYDGLWVVDSAQVTVKDSTVSGNGDDGLFVGDSAQVTVQNSWVYDNLECGIQRSGEPSIAGRGNWLGYNRQDFCGFDPPSGFLGGSPPSWPFQGTIEVCPEGCPFSSIREAVLSVAPGSTLKIAPGTYTGAFWVWVYKPLRLEGSGPDQTVIRGGAYRIGSRAEVTLQDLTLTGGALVVGGSARVTFKNSRVSGNKLDGLFVRDSAQVTVQNSQVSDNGCDGLDVGDDARVWVIGNAFLNNEGYGIEAGSPDNIVECRGNRFEGNGSGPYDDEAAQKCR